MFRQRCKYHPLMLWIVIIILIILLLPACGGDNKDDGASDNGQSTDNADDNRPSNGGQSTNGAESLLDGLPPPSQSTLRLPTIEDVGGRLAFMQGNALYIASFDGQPATLIDTYVNHYTLQLSPDRHTLSYVAAVAGDDNTESELILKLVNLDTLEGRTLLTVTGSTSRVLAWSPSGDHLLMVGPGNGGLSVVDIESASVEELVFAQATSQPMAPEPEGAWLSDGRVFFLAPIDGDRSLLQPMVYDLATGESTVLNLPLSENPRDLLDIETPLKAQNLLFAPMYRHINRTIALSDSDSRVTIQLPSAVWNFQTQVCDRWRIDLFEQNGAVQRELYSADATYLSDLRLLPDNSLLFLEWQQPNCSFNTNLQISLKRLTLEGDIETLTNDISPQFDGNFGLLLYHHTQRYDLTPDGRYIVWLSGDIADATTGIGMIDLETGESAAFIQTTARSEASSFLNVFWIPSPPDETTPDEINPSTETEPDDE